MPHAAVIVVTCCLDHGYEDTDNAFHFFTELRVNLTVHLCLMVVVVRQCTMDLRQTEGRMLSVDFVSIPMVCQTVQDDFYYFGLRASNVWHAGARDIMCG